MRSMAAFNLAAKVAYLRLSDVIGPDNPSVENTINNLQRASFKPGKVIERRGTALYYLKSGAATIFRIAKNGNRFDVKRVGPGTVFGDEPLLGQSMLGAQAEAIEPSTVIFLTPGDIRKLLASPDIGLNVLQQIGPKLVEEERKQEQSAFQPVTSRLSALLLRLKDSSHQVTGYTHQDLADMLGVYRETVTNALAELKADKMIKIARKRITLSNLDALRTLEAL
jgi:CRP-like cAMP-binding protein